MSWRSGIAELRTTLTGVDPGLVRLQLAGIATASMVLAVVLMSGVRALTGQPVTVVLISAVLAMVSNLAVNEDDLGRRRVTTALMLGPALVAVSVGTLLAPHRIVADIVFVAVLMVAVYIRRFGPRGNALGMAAVMGYFFTQFLQATVSQLPWLLLAAAIGIGSTLLLRGVVFAERPERTLERLTRAFRAHVHGLVDAVADLLSATPDDIDHALDDLARRRTRLNETAILVTSTVEQLSSAEDGEPAGRSELNLRILDAELAAERLAVATRRLVEGDDPPGDEVRRPLLAGLHAIVAASATGAPDSRVSALLDSARRSIGPLVAETDGLGDRAQRVAFALSRLADALQPPDSDTTSRDPTGRSDAPEPPPAPDEKEPAPDTEVDTPDEPTGLRLTTRQAVQVGVATSLAIVIGELVSPARWYWAVIAAFVVFAGTTSRGDVLNRGSQRIIGTIGGVLAGMGLATIVGDVPLPALILMSASVFLALYLVRVSQALMAFWITTVLALLYGLIGQFSVATLVVRIEETAVGAVLGILAGYLVLPKGTREAFGEALDDMVDGTHAVLDATVDQILGRATESAPVDLARDMDDTLGVLRQRAKPLDNPLPRRRGRSSYQRALRVLTGVDHYVRRLARISDAVEFPEWAPTLEPATARVRANLDGLRALLLHREPEEIRSAEALVDAAEAQAARTSDGRLRAELLTVARLLRRIDQLVVGFAIDLGGHEEHRDTVPVGTPPTGH